MGYEIEKRCGSSRVTSSEMVEKFHYMVLRNQVKAEEIADAMAIY